MQVVPACYRRYFPVHLKSHRSHDIVLLCVDCHERAQITAEEVKRQLAAECVTRQGLISLGCSRVMR